MRTITAYFEDGDTITTAISGTTQEITRYYLNQVFNHGVVEDRLVKCVGIVFHS